MPLMFALLQGSNPTSTYISGKALAWTELDREIGAKDLDNWHLNIHFVGKGTIYWCRPVPPPSPSDSEEESAGPGKVKGKGTAGQEEKLYTVIWDVPSDPKQSLLFMLPDQQSLIEEPPLAALHSDDDKNCWGMSVILTLPVHDLLQFQDQNGKLHNFHPSKIPPIESSLPHLAPMSDSEYRASSILLTCHAFWSAMQKQGTECFVAMLSGEGDTIGGLCHAHALFWPSSIPTSHPNDPDPLVHTTNQLLPTPNSGHHAYWATNASACLPMVGIGWHPSALVTSLWGVVSLLGDTGQPRHGTATLLYGALQGREASLLVFG
ncbi:hypothetical protein BKA83DRAFT_4128761 [Pisolithus microcarpus]|nr:hypothetical protein BKA83DRAFT_4128761 [Pisolithus microcarpus]